jgi:signal transduction histidine kinase
MRFRTALTLAFSFFLAVSSISSLIFVFRLFNSYSSVMEDSAVPRALDAAIEAYRMDLPASARLEEITQDVLAARRGYGRLGVEKKGLMIGALETFLGFLLGQVALLVALSYLAARFLTRPLSLVRAGLERIEAGETRYRLPALPGREIGLVGSRLNRMLDVIAEKERLLAEQSRLLGWQEVASFLAHQIKNPLAALSLSSRNLDLSLNGESRSGIVAESLDIISRESRRVGDLISRFREAVRFPEPRTELTDMASLVESVAALVPRDQARFILDLERGIELLVDTALIREALSNLFTNSIEASGGTVEIAIRLRRVGSHCHISIDDNVRDVPEETARMVLSSAFSTKPKGSGLGLLFVRKVMALHGGAISARREADGGLVFELRLKGERGGEGLDHR